MVFNLYSCEYLSGALVRRALEERRDYQGEFLALDVKHAGGGSFCDADCTIHKACTELRHLMEKNKIFWLFYRIGGDEFVVLTDDAGMDKIKKKLLPTIRKYFHAKVGKKLSNMEWAEAFQEAMKGIR